LPRRAASEIAQAASPFTIFVQALPSVSAAYRGCGERRKTMCDKDVAGKTGINNLRVGEMAAKMARFVAAV
jgi:hypothetical protein